MDTKDQYDLMDAYKNIANKTGSGINTIFLFIKSFIAFSWKKKYILMLLFLIVNIGGILYYKLSKPIYKTEAIFQLNVGNSMDILPYIKKLNYIDTSTLSKVLDTELKYCRNIKKIIPGYIIDYSKDGIGDYIDYKNKADLTDTNIYQIKNRFAIKLKLKDIKNTLPKLQEAILLYLNNNIYLKNENLIRHELLKNQITTNQEEIIKLDSLERKDYFEYRNQNKPNTGQLMVMKDQQVFLYHEDIKKLNKDLTNLISEQKYKDKPVELVEPFYMAASPINNIINIFSLTNIIAALLSIILILIIKKD